MRMNTTYVKSVATMDITTALSKRGTVPSIWKKAAGLLSSTKASSLLKEVTASRKQWEQRLNSIKSV